MAVKVRKESQPRIRLKGANSSTVGDGILLGTGDGNRTSMTFTATAEPVIVIPEGPVTNVQLEAGSFATSYIPNNATSGTVTRSADIASIPVSAFGYNQTAGTLVVEASFNSRSDGQTFHRTVELSNGSSSRLAMFDDANQSNEYIRYFVRDDTGSNVFGAANLSGSDQSEVNLAIAYAADDMAIYGGNGQSATGSSGQMGTDVDTLNIGKESNNTSCLNGHIKSLKYYPRRLTDAQLQTLTS